MTRFSSAGAPTRASIALKLVELHECSREVELHRCTRFVGLAIPYCGNNCSMVLHVVFRRGGQIIHHLSRLSEAA